jgi:hypothetical protein
MVAISKSRGKTRSKKSGRVAIKTRADLAATFETSITTVANWCRKPDFPGGPKGPWDRDDVELYLRRHGSPIVRSGVDAAAEEARSFARQMNQEELLMRRARREQEEIRRDEIKGELVRRSEVESRFAEGCAFIRDMVLMIPDQVMAVTPEAMRAQFRQDVQEIVNGILRQIASFKSEGVTKRV